MSKNLDLKVVLAAREKITGPLKKVTATTTGTARALKQAQAETRELQRHQGNIQAYRTARAGLRSVQQGLKATKSAQENYSQSLEKQRAAHDELKAKTKEARLSQRSLASQMQRTKEPSTALVRDYQLASKRLAELETKQDRSYSSIKKYKEGIRTTDKQLNSLNRENDRYRKNLNDSRKRLDEAGISTSKLGQKQRELAGNIGRTNDRIQSQKRYLEQLGKADVSGKFNNMTSEVGRFGRRAALLGGGAAAGVFGIANSTASLGDEVAKTGDKIGIALGPFQELRYAAERSGVSTQKFDSSLERFVKRMGEATQGTGAAKKAYEELGLSAENLSQMTPEDSLGVVADRLSSVENQSQRVALAAQLFGREGVAMVNMMKDGSAGMEQLRKDARATGYAMTDDAARGSEKFKDALLDVQLGMKGMKNVIGAELQPAITSLMKDLFGWMKENKGQVQEFAKQFGTKLKNAVPILKDIAKGAASTAKTLGVITSNLASMVGGFDNLGMVLAVILAMKPIMAIAGMAKALFVAGTAVYGLVSSLGAVGAAIKVLKVVMISTGVGALIVAIGTAAYLIYKHWDGIASWFKGLWSDVKTAFSGGLGGIGKLILNWSPLGLFYKAFSKVFSWFGVELPNTFTGFGKQILDGLVGGLMGGLKKVKDTIVNAGKQTIGWFKDVLGIKSPSRVFMSAGQDTLEGYRRGIQKQEPNTLKQVSGFGKRVRQVGAGIAIGASTLPAAAGSVQFDDRAPVASQPQASGQASGDQYTFQIYGAPGQDEREIAAQIERILRDRDRRKANRAGSALYDRE